MRKLLIANREQTPPTLGNYFIGQEDIISGKIEDLMKCGKLIIVDIDDLNIVVLQTLILYIARHRYKGYSFNDNKSNFFIKIAPERALTYIDRIEEMEDEIIDLSKYWQIVHFGDIHGCFDTLMKAWKEHYSKDKYFIFLGDFIDRGKQNDKVIEFMLSIYNLPNVTVIEGNHDTNLWHWCTDSPEYLSKGFKDTRHQLEGSKVEREQIKKFCLALRENIIYKHNEKTVMASHGGLYSVPKVLYEVDSSQYIHSQGDDHSELDKIFTDNLIDINTYQVHGHSNFCNKKSNAFPNSINLEGGVEYGGSLRVCTLSKMGLRFYYYQNEVSAIQNFFINKQINKE